MSDVPRVPISLKLVGVFWIGLGVLALASGSWLQLGPRLAPPGSIATLPRGWWAISVTQTAFGVIGILAGVAFLRLRRWARGVIEALTWVVLLLFLGVQAITLHRILATSAGGTAGAAIAGAAVFFVPCFLVLRAVRGPSIRNAFGRT